jgi:hypothetical protein
MEIKRFSQFIKESEGNKSLILNPYNLSVIKDDGKESMLLRDRDTNKIWFFYYNHIDKKDFSEFGDVEKTYIGKDEDGEPEFEYDYENYEPTESDKLEYIKANIKNLTIGKGVDSYERGDDLTEVDQILSHVLLDTFIKFTHKDLEL